MLINVDFDGVIIPNDFEKKFVLKGLEGGFTKISQFDGKLFDWYIEKVCTSISAPINVGLLKQLSILRDQGHFIRLWTNRSIELKDPTIKNLGEWSGLFDSFKFYSSSKSRSRVEGVAIDNSITNLRCAEHGGIFYEWR